MCGLHLRVFSAARSSRTVLYAEYGESYNDGTWVGGGDQNEAMVRAARATLPLTAEKIMDRMKENGNDGIIDAMLIEVDQETGELPPTQSMCVILYV